MSASGGREAQSAARGDLGSGVGGGEQDAGSGETALRLRW